MPWRWPSRPRCSRYWGRRVGRRQRALTGQLRSYSMLTVMLYSGHSEIGRWDNQGRFRTIEVTRDWENAERDLVT
jgi:hypothetical protein